jgi:hypothetical protein
MKFPKLNTANFLLLAFLISGCAGVAPKQNLETIQSMPQNKFYSSPEKALATLSPVLEVTNAPANLKTHKTRWEI